MSENLDASCFIEERQSGVCLFALRSAGADVEKGEIKFHDRGNVVRIHFPATQKELVRNVIRQFGHS